MIFKCKFEKRIAKILGEKIMKFLIYYKIEGKNPEKKMFM
jgi:hypothetical protein